MKQVDDPQLKTLIAELATWREALSGSQSGLERNAEIKRLEEARDAQT